MKHRDSDDARQTTTDDFWRDIRAAERDADRLARPSVMESFKDWGELLNSPSETPSDLPAPSFSDE